MESVNLLVLDRTPEPAEHVNSALRNAGIKIHVIHVESYSDVARAIEAHAPLLIIYADPDPVAAGLEEIAALSREHALPCVLYCPVDDTERLTGMLKTASCYVIDAENPEQLISSVSAFMDAQQRLQRSRSQQSQLDELGHRFELLMESARDAIAYIHEGLHVYANRSYLDSLRLQDATDLQGLSLLEMMRVPEGNLKSILRDLSKGNFPNSAVDVEVTRPDGTSFDASLQFSSAKFNGEPCIQMILHKQDQAAELAAELERLRHTDPLTHLPNRAHFTSLLSSVLEEEFGSEAAAVFYVAPDTLDPDGSSGEIANIDAYVAELASVIKEYVEDSDICGRISDQGIALLIRRREKQQIEAMATAIQQAFKSVIIEVDGRSISTSCSIGVAHLGRLSKNAGEVIEQARKACIEAGEQGDAVVEYRPHLTAVALAEEEGEWVERIRLGLKNDDFYAIHQSIVDLDGEGEQLIENLVFLRGEESDHAFSEFGQIAEKHDLAGAIDRNVIPSILKTVTEGDERQVISLSTHSMIDPGFPAWLLDHFKMYAVDTKKLIVQIAADTAQANLKPTQRLLRELAPLGCRISISGFGPERRTLQLFDHLTAQYVKLDTSLTAQLQGNSKAQDSIQEIVDAAKQHDAVVIADEISDTSNLAILWQCGVKMIAGAFLKETAQAASR